MTAPAVTLVRGAHWLGTGQVMFEGAALQYLDRLDRRVVAFAQQWGAIEERHPAMLPVADLARAQYFESFPHLATFATTLAPDPLSLRRFSESASVTRNGTLTGADVQPISLVLTPAACYHIYIHHAGQVFTAPRRFTTRNTCFRHEESVVPFERLRAFTMREIVCIGTPPECANFLERASAFGGRLAGELGLATSWQPAFDPFFQPAASAFALMQRLEPSKSELQFQGRLALASTNDHRQHFGRAYDLRTLEGGVTTHATTACIAFGWERWMSAMGQTHGPEPADWPSPDSELQP